ncbi:tetratricopeptide repeat protein [Aquimarina rubra]|uniref:Tol-pal system YbgF family protein n=1 Tax=Aquimarina rubra TaxID=1920033 RepID=A0ABW5LGL4_9FLAO
MEREELIDKYLQSELTSSEKDQFDSLLENDATFRDEVELFKNLKVVTGTEDRDKLRKSMADFEAKIAANETKVIPLFNYKKLLVAASILLVVAIGGITFLNPFGVDTNQLYADNFEPYKNVVTPIVRGENDKDDEVIAFTSYESKDYNLAADQFETLYETTKRPYFLLYQANSLLASDKVKEAIPLLEKHITLQDELSERSKWYLSLAYLKENRKDEAIVLLEEILEKGTFKKGDVERLLKQLK